MSRGKSPRHSSQAMSTSMVECVCDVKECTGTIRCGKRQNEEGTTIGGSKVRRKIKKGKRGKNLMLRRIDDKGS